MVHFLMGQAAVVLEDVVVLRAGCGSELLGDLEDLKEGVVGNVG